MPRHKDRAWDLPDHCDYPAATLGVLMDIRDELKLLNNHIQCHEFINIPRVLRAIQRNTAKKKGARKAARV